MNSTEYSYATKNIAVCQEAKSRFPRILFLPWAGVDPDQGPTVVERGLTAEGWQVTHVSEAQTAGAASSDKFMWLPAVIGERLRLAQSMVRLIPKYDLVHISCRSIGQMILEGLLSLVLARFFGKRVVLHFGSAATERLLEPGRRSFLPFLKLADTIVVGSRYLQKAFGRAGLEARILIQPRELEAFAHQVRTNLQPRILVDCDLDPDLNAGCAIRAYRLVKQKYPRAELIVVGDGAERSRLSNLVEHDNFYNVEFCGKLSQARLVELYRDCDVLLHTPMVDESPPSLARAFAAGLPVVVTDADGILPLVRDRVSGLIAPAGDHVALADAVIELVENSELTEKLSRQGADEAKKQSWARVRQDWVNLYTELWR